MAIPGPRCCLWAFSSCGKQGLLFVAAHRLPTAVAFSRCQAQSIKHRLSTCGAGTQLLQGMWDLPGPGIEPLSPALAIRFLTTRPPETLIRDQGALGSRSCSTCPAVCLGKGPHPRGAKGSQTCSTMSCRPRVTGEHKHTCVSTHRCTWVNRYYLQDTQIYSYMCNLLPQGGAP